MWPSCMEAEFVVMFIYFKIFNLTLLFSHKIVSNSFATPWIVAHQTPLSMGFPRQEYWIELPFPSLRDLPSPEIEAEYPALQVDSLPPSHLGSPNLTLESVKLKFPASIFSPRKQLFPPFFCFFLSNYNHI